MRPNILALDTSAGACSVACLQGGIAVEKYECLARGHAEALVPMVASVMENSGLPYDQLDVIAVTIGPGTFTGVRIGLAAARGLALASSKPMVGVTTFEAVAYGVQTQGRSVLVVMDARRGQLYAQVFDFMLMPVCPPSVLPIQKIRSLKPSGQYIVAGTGVALARPHLLESTVSESDVIFDMGSGLPRAATVARIASIREPQPSETIRPIYLRAPDAVSSLVVGGGAIRV